MKIEISEWYKNKGFDKAYTVINKDNRRMCLLVGKQNRTTISYAKYLYTSHYNVDVFEGDHVDHINGDKTDDRLENLQVISGTYNRQKDHVHKEMIELECPVCNRKFLFKKPNLNSHPNPCCSRRCGGIKSH